MRFRWVVFLLLTLLGLVACLPQLGTSKTPNIGFRFGERILVEPFETVGEWDTYNLQGLSIDVDEGVYRIQSELEAYVWGQHSIASGDIVIDVKVEQLSSYNHNGYGVMCRANRTNNGRGYYFLISGDGQVSIRWGDGQRAVHPIVRWTPSSVVKRGQARNQLRIVCIQDYLALYVNGELVAQAQDNRTHSGDIGLVAVLPTENSIDITFDNLIVWDAELSINSVDSE